MVHPRSLRFTLTTLGLLWLPLVSPWLPLVSLPLPADSLWRCVGVLCGAEGTLAQPPRTEGWLQGLREMIEGTKGRPLEITHSKGQVVLVLRAEMDGPGTIKATKADGAVVLIPLVEVQQMETR